MVYFQIQLTAAYEFIDRSDDNPQYKWIDGELIDLASTGIHGQVAAFIGRKHVAIEQQNIPYLLPSAYRKLKATGNTGKK